MKLLDQWKKKPTVFKGRIITPFMYADDTEPTYAQLKSIADHGIGCTSYSDCGYILVTVKENTETMKEAINLYRYSRRLEKCQSL